MYPRRRICFPARFREAYRKDGLIGNGFTGAIGSAVGSVAPEPKSRLAALDALVALPDHVYAVWTLPLGHEPLVAARLAASSFLRISLATIRVARPS
jgi:hypothetical protein